MSSPIPSPKRDAIIIAVLVYIGLANLWGAYRHAEIYWDLVSHGDPSRPHWPYLAFSILSILVVISVVGLWIWRKWGLYLFIFTQVAGILVSTALIGALGLPHVTISILIGLIGPAILLSLYYREWENLK
jgi:hypothetical protein